MSDFASDWMPIIIEDRLERLKAMLAATGKRYANPDRPCKWCGADGTLDEPKQFFERVERCNNCRVDIQMWGEWSGTGFAHLLAFLRRIQPTDQYLALVLRAYGMEGQA